MKTKELLDPPKVPDYLLVPRSVQVFPDGTVRIPINTNLSKSPDTELYGMVEIKGDKIELVAEALIDEYLSLLSSRAKKVWREVHRKSMSYPDLEQAIYLAGNIKAIAKSP